MTSLTQKLEQLKIEILELEKKIQDDKNREEKLNKEPSIERLEELIKPFTEYLDKKRNIKNNFSKKGKRKVTETSIRQFLEEYQKDDKNYEEQDEFDIHYPHNFEEIRYIDRDFDVLEQEEIFVTLMDILKKQDERIKELEK